MDPLQAWSQNRARTGRIDPVTSGVKRRVFEGFDPRHIRVVDVETQGHRSRSYYIDPKTGMVQKAGRGSGEALMVSEMAYGRLGEHLGYRQGVTRDGIHTWIAPSIYDDLLKKHGLTYNDIERLRKESGPKFQKLARELSPSRAWGSVPPGFPLPGRWDPAVTVHDSVPNQVLRRFLIEVLESKKPGSRTAVSTYQDVSRAVLDDWKYVSPGKLRTHREALGFAAWNVGYDLSRTVEMLQDTGFGDEAARLIQTGVVRPLELATSVRRMQFDAMLRNKNWMPVFSDRAKINAAFGQGVRKVSAEKMRKMGLVREYTELRELMDDFATGSEFGRQKRILRRAKTLYAKMGGAERAQARNVARDIAGRLGKVRTYDDLTDALTYFQQRWSDKTLEFGWKAPTQLRGRQMSALQFMEEMYRSKGTDRHINLFGDPKVLGLFNSGDMVPFAGLETPFQYVTGGGLDDAVEVLASRAKDLGVSPDRAAQYQAFRDATQKKDLIERMAHEAYHDTRIEEMVARDLDRIEQNEVQRALYIDDIVARSNQRATNVVNRHLEDLAGTLPDTHPIKTTAHQWEQMLSRSKQGIQQAKTWLNKGNNKLWVAGAALGIGVLSYLFRNRARDTVEASEIEGLRNPESEWLGIQGIEASDLPFSNLSAFGSGRGPETPPLEHPSKPSRQPLDTVHAERLTAESRQATQRSRAVAQALRGETRRARKTPFARDVQVPHKLARPEPEYSIFPSRTSSQEVVTPPPAPPPGAPAPAPGQWAGLGTRHHTEYRGGHLPRMQGMAGYLTRMETCLSRVRDQATQLQRLPLMIQTPKGRGKPNLVGHAEREMGRA